MLIYLVFWLDILVKCTSTVTHISLSNTAPSLFRICLEINNTCAYLELLRVCEELKDERGLGIEFRNSKRLLLLGTHITYKRPSNLHELGKVFDMPKEEIDQIIAYLYPDHYKDDQLTRILRLRPK